MSVPDWKSYASIFIIVTENLQGVSRYWNIKVRVLWLLDEICGAYLCKFVGAWDFSPYFKPHSHPLFANSNEPRTPIVHVLPSIWKFCAHVRRLDSFCSNNDRASIVGLTIMREWSRKSLCFGTHESSHTSFNLSNFVVWPRTIVINDLKPELL